MMKPPAAFAGLEDLLDLGHGNGIDMRPTLLRVLTDLYLQRPTHTPEDERYYTELAFRLIDATDVSARAALAARLAAYPSAPARVIERLARDVIEVAAPILAHSPCLTPADLARSPRSAAGAHAEIDRRTACGRSGGRTRPTRPRGRRPGPRLASCRNCSTRRDAPERRLILINLEYASLRPVAARFRMQRADVWRLESAALQHNAETVVRELGRTLGVSRGAGATHRQ